VSWRNPSPDVLLLIAAALAAVAGPSFLFGVLAAHDALFYYIIFAVAIVLLLLAAARAAHTEHSRWAAALGAAASTPAVGFIVVTYGYSQAHSLDGHPFGWAAMLLAAVLYLGCVAVASVLAPLKLRAGVGIVLGTMFWVATSLLFGFYVLVILSGAGSG
jgi:hypothetical protein